MEGLPKLPSDIDLRPFPSKLDSPSGQDNRLVTWERNQRESERVQKTLQRGTRRSKHQLLMNSLDKHRRTQERRTLVAYAQIPCRFDKYRGNPKWWELPPKLHKVCDEVQEYFIHQTRLERYIVPQLEYVRSGRPSLHTFFKESRKISRELTRLDSFCVNRIQPHVPDLEGVVVIGEKLKCQSAPGPNRSSSDNVDGSIFKFVEFNEPRKRDSFERDAFTFMIINDQKLMSDSQGTIKTSVLFTSTCANATEVGHLVVHNRSTWALRISFEETKKEATIAGGSSGSDSGGHFYFDRNVRVLLPAEQVDVPFWFKNPQCGFFDQLMRMSVVPDLWRGKLSILISLNAQSFEADQLEKCGKYEKMIQDRVRSRMIRRVLSDLLKEVPPVPSQDSNVKVYTYNKGIIFEAMNSRYDPLHDRPKYLYDKEVVDELETFYESVRLEQHPEYWSLSVNDLRTVAKDRETFERARGLEADYAHVFEVIEKNKETREAMRERLDKLFQAEKGAKKGKGDKSDKKKLSTSPKEKRKDPKKDKAGEKTSSKKDRAKKEALKMKEPDRQDFPKTLSDHLEDIIAKLRSPLVLQDVHCQRYKLAYNLLCAYLDKISMEVQEMCRNYFSLERPDPLEVVRNAFNPTHMRCEQFLSCEMETKAFFERPTIRGTPQPPWALEIPMDDYRARYEAMHPPVEDRVKRKGKKGRGNDDGVKKPEKGSKKKERSSLQSKTTKGTKATKKTKKASVVDDLFAEECLEEEGINIEDVQGRDDDWYYLIPHEKVDHYRNNVYTVFYKNLCDFVDDLEMVYHMTSGESPTPAQIQRIKFSQQKDQLLDQGLQLECIDLKQRISQLLTHGDVDDDLGDEPIKSPSLFIQRDREDDLLPKSSSVWDVIKAYVPQRLRRRPIGEDDVYALEASRAKRADDGTDVTPEEVITEKNVQTDICSDISVRVSDALLPRDVKLFDVCICGKSTDPRDIEKRTSSFHNSECFQSSVSTPDSPDISSLSDDL